MTTREYRSGNRQHDRRLDVALTAFLIMGCLFVAGRASLRVVGLADDAPSGIRVLEVTVGEPMAISAETDPTALVGFYSPEDHGAWLGGETGLLRLGASDGGPLRSVRVLLLAADTGDELTKVITVNVAGAEQTIELGGGTSEWLTFDVSSAPALDVAIQCTPAAAPSDGDVRALCVLLSAIVVDE